MLTTLSDCLAVAMDYSKWWIFYANYGRQWDIKFNATKSQCITFGGNRASSRIILNNAELTRVAKLKYLGCFFFQ